MIWTPLQKLPNNVDDLDKLLLRNALKVAQSAKNHPI